MEYACGRRPWGESSRSPGSGGCAVITQCRGERAQQSRGTQREEKPQDLRWGAGLGLCGGGAIPSLPLKPSRACPADQGPAHGLNHQGVEQNLQSRGCRPVLVTVPRECVISEALHSEAGQSPPGPANPRSRGGCKGSSSLRPCERANSSLPFKPVNTAIQTHSSAR